MAVLKVALLLELLFVVGDLVFNSMDLCDDLSIRRIWNIAREQSLPTWFSSFQAQLVGLTALLIAMAAKRQATKKACWAWIGIALFFFYVGLDDFVELHERLGGVVDRSITQFSGTAPAKHQSIFKQSYSWHTYLAPLYSIVVAAIALFSWKPLKKAGALLYFLLGLTCWATSQALDYLEGLRGARDAYIAIGNALHFSHPSYVSHLSKLVEEVLEMLGTTLIWVAFLHYLGLVAQGKTIRIAYDGKPQTLNNDDPIVS
ncbi:hypothetical protein [Pontiella desulfatans]|nr:hypothetical protein [Pontiella desulfatans]